MDKPHPYLTAALLCEKVLQEKDESLSVIHLADKITYATVGMPAGVKPAAQISGLLCLKSGPVTGDHTVKIVVENPTGDRKEVFSMPVTLLGNDHGANVIMNITLGIEVDGLYWFDVVFDDDVLTRIPLVVMQAQQPPTQTGGKP